MQAVVSELRQEHLRWARERDLLHEQLRCANELRQQKEEQQRAVLISNGTSIGTEGGSGRGGAAIGRAPTDADFQSGSYSAADHQLNLLYFHQLLYAALREEKDLVFLERELAEQELSLQKQLEREQRMLHKLTERTAEITRAHKYTLAGEQQRAVELLSLYKEQEESARIMMHELRALARFWAQVHGWERALPEPVLPEAESSSSQKQSVLEEQQHRNAQTNNPMLPSCSRCFRSLLPTAEDEALLARLRRDKRAHVQQHTKLFALSRANAPTGMVGLVAGTGSPAQALRPQSAFTSSFSPQSQSLPLQQQHNVLSSPSSSSSLRFNSSVTSSQAARKGKQQGAAVEWAMLDRLAAMASGMAKQQRGGGGAKGGANKAKSNSGHASVTGAKLRSSATAAMTNTVGIPATPMDRMRAAHEQNAGKFTGGGILRPQSAMSSSMGHNIMAAEPAGFNRTSLFAHSSASTAEGSAAARMLQLQLLSRERLASCAHFVHMLSGQPVCRACRYALESLPPRPLMRPLSASTSSAEEKTSSSFEQSSLSHTQRILGTLFTPDQTAVRFAQQRKQVKLDEAMKLQPTPSSSSSSGAEAAGSSSRPQTATALRSHVVGARPLPSRSDVQSTAASLSLQLDRRALAAVPDTLTLLKRLRDVLGFHAPQQQQQQRAQPRAAQHAGRSRPASAHDVSSGPRTKSGQIAVLAATQAEETEGETSRLLRLRQKASKSFAFLHPPAS
jgi:hypothetical protein